MTLFRIIGTPALAVAMTVCSPLVSAQSAGLQQKLESQYVITKTTADGSDIVTAGAVLVLQKDNLLMDTTTSAARILNTYRGGKLSHGVGDILTNKWLHKIPGISSVPLVDSRTFVAGEKIWVTKIEIHDDGVLFYLFSDPISDTRYYATLKFPFARGSTADTNTMLRKVAEVLKVADSAGDSKQLATVESAAGEQQAVVSTPKKAMPSIAPPPPPVDAPPPEP